MTFYNSLSCTQSAEKSILVVIRPLFPRASIYQTSVNLLGLVLSSQITALVCVSNYLDYLELLALFTGQLIHIIGLYTCTVSSFYLNEILASQFPLSIGHYNCKCIGNIFCIGIYQLTNRPV